MQSIITKEFKWEMGHRLLGHKGLCAHLHGHSYRAEFEITSKGEYPSYLDGVGMLMDFSELKKVVASWIDENWDHAFMVNRLDPAINYLKAIPIIGPTPPPPARIVVVDYNPTAENIAADLLTRFHGLASPNYFISRVTVWETATSSASAQP